jgi:hypothetical protein
MQPGLLVIERADTVRDAGMIRSVRARLGAVVVGVDADRWEPALAPSSPAAPGGPAARAALVPGVDPGLAACVDVVAEVNGLTDGTHRMLRLAERATEGGDPFALTAIFEFVQTGLGEAGELLGEYRATRAIPRFVERRKARGKRVDLSLFQ